MDTNTITWDIIEADKLAPPSDLSECREWAVSVAGQLDAMTGYLGGDNDESVIVVAKLLNISPQAIYEALRR